jgi:hypothetical protein
VPGVGQTVTIGVGTTGAEEAEGTLADLGLVTVTTLVEVDVYVTVVLIVVVGSTTGTTVMVCLTVEASLGGTVPTGTKIELV